MIKLKTRLALFNLFSKLAFAALFLVFLPGIVERVNLRQVDNDLVEKREKTIDLISRFGIEPFIYADSTDSFGSYNILKEEYISLEKTVQEENLNQVEVSDRSIEDDIITYRVLKYSLIVDGTKYLLEIGKSLSTINQARSNISRIIILFVLLIIIITFTTDLQYTRQILKPLERLTDKLKTISSPAFFDKSPLKTNTLDFVSLDKALRDLMERIDESFRKEKDITVNISHELLTPVSVLRSKLENILLQKETDHETAIRVEESLKTLHRLQSLVNSLLMIARIESQQYLREDNFSVKGVLEEIIEELNPLSEDKKVNLTGEFFSDLKLEKANRSLIFSMFYNVINNAVKNTAPGGIIAVRCFEGDKGFQVQVRDNGKGMDKEQLSTLFSRFKSGRGSESGTGIGLAITKSIADLHGIKIDVSSEPGYGTGFLFTLRGE